MWGPLPPGTGTTPPAPAPALGPGSQEGPQPQFRLQPEGARAQAAVRSNSAERHPPPRPCGSLQTRSDKQMIADVRPEESRSGPAGGIGLCMCPLCHRGPRRLSLTGSRSAHGCALCGQTARHPRNSPPQRTLGGGSWRSVSVLQSLGPFPWKRPPGIF